MDAFVIIILPSFLIALSACESGITIN